MLSENSRVRAKIPAAFEHLMGPHIEKVDHTIEPGLSELTWTSINLDHYTSSVYKALGDLELLMDWANDLVKFRINGVLKSMSNAKLCELPDEEPWTVDHFLEHTQVSGPSQVCSTSHHVMELIFVV